MSAPMKPDDPAYWMLEQGREDPSKRSIKTVHSDSCYICKDPEFALMGLPLCYPCGKCGGHVAADDCVCDACGLNQQDLPGEDLDNARENAEHEARARRCERCGVADMPFEPFDPPVKPLNPFKPGWVCVDHASCEVRQLMKEPL